jgi:hypothetical protein
MPYDIKRNYGDCKGYAVVGPGGVKGCHTSRSSALNQQRALYAAESNSKKSDTGIITSEDVPQAYPHSIEDCPDPKNCPDHMASYHEETNKKAPCWDGYVQRGMKPGEGGRMVPNCVPVKKADMEDCQDLIKAENEMQEGMFVMGPGNEYTKEHSHGKIEHIMRDGGLAMGSEFEVIATLDDPAILIRIYKQSNGSWQGTDLFTAFKSSEAMLIGTEEDMMSHSMEKAESVRVGQMVSWNSSGGRAEGKVIRVIRNGKFKVPNSSFEITGTPEEPAAAIRLYRDGEPTDTVVGHKVKTLTVKKSMQEDDIEKRSLEDLDLKPTESMASNARRGLELRRKFGRGGTAVGVARARDLSNRNQLSPDTVLRMYSFFSRHEVDKKGKDFNNSERPSNGKIAWLLWGGDSGFAWAKSKRNAIMNIRSQKSNSTIWQNSALNLKKNIDKYN